MAVLAYGYKVKFDVEVIDEAPDWVKYAPLDNGEHMIVSVREMIHQASGEDVALGEITVAPEQRWKVRSAMGALGLKPTQWAQWWLIP